MAAGIYPFGCILVVTIDRNAIFSIVSFSYISEVLDILFKSELNQCLVLFSEKLDKPVPVALWKGLVWFTYSVECLENS